MPRKEIWLLVGALVGLGLCSLQLQLSYFEQIEDNKFPLYFFYVNLLVGSNHQSQSLIIDTGSQYTAFPCHSTCTSCAGDPQSYFNLTASESRQVLTCRNEQRHFRHCKCEDNKCVYKVEQEQGDQYQGSLVRDQVCLGEQWDQDQTITYKFGCHTQETKLPFDEQVDGIMGLGKPVVTSADYSLPTALFKAHKVEHDMFAICLGKQGGILSIGNYNQSLHIEPSTHPLFAYYYGQSLFTLSLRSIVVWETWIDISGYQMNAVIDSGTTHAQIPPHIYEQASIHVSQIAQALFTFCDSNPLFCQSERNESADQSLCFKKPEQLSILDFYSSFPPLFFILEYHIVEWLPSEYFFPWQGLQCLSIQRGGSEPVLGVTFLRQKNAIFDLEQKQMALVNANCTADSNRVLIDRNNQDIVTTSHIYVDRAGIPLGLGGEFSALTYPALPQGENKEGLSLLSKIIIFALVMAAVAILILVCFLCCRQSEEKRRPVRLEEDDEEEANEGEGQTRESQMNRKTHEYAVNEMKADEPSGDKRRKKSGEFDDI